MYLVYYHISLKSTIESGSIIELAFQQLKFQNDLNIKINYKINKESKSKK